MKLTKKRIGIGLTVLLALVLSVMSWASLYPKANLLFSGITLTSNNVDEPSTQAFLNINLNNVNATGAAFCIQYDMDYLCLSDADTNKPIENPVLSSPMYRNPYNIQHKFFKQNPDFPDETFKDWGANPLAYPSLSLNIIGTADQDLSRIDEDKVNSLAIADQDFNQRTGHVIMSFSPYDSAADEAPDYFENKELDNEVFPTILANTDDGLDLGQISFKILNPAKFARLTQDQLENVIQIVPFSSMLDVNDDGSGLPKDDRGVYILCIDEEEDTKPYYRGEFDLRLAIELVDVKPQVEEITVSSYDIYKNGTLDDLLDFLNSKMSLISLFYADDSEVPGVFEWNDTDSNISSLTWDPKGGDYTITQPFNDDFDITVKVHVKPIELIGFEYDNKYRTDLIGADDFPDTLEKLKLPTKVRPVLDTYIRNGGVPKLDLDTNQYMYDSAALTGMPAGYGTGPASYTIYGTLVKSITDIQNDYKWLTVSSLPDIEIFRNVVDNASDLPIGIKVVSAVTDDDGVLTIEIEPSDPSQSLDTSSEFVIRLPDGTVIDTSKSYCDITSITTAGATITLSPDITNTSEKQAAQMINLGKRAGEFAIACTEPGKLTGEYATFNPEPRKNIYLDSYVFDYSTNLAQMFTIKASTTLPTTITLPYSAHRVETTYDGHNGDETGFLATFTVDNWSISGDTATPGEIITAEGTLSTTEYTNYGTVTNENGETVTLKYIVANNDDDEKINDIADFTFNSQQVGYDYDKLQTHTFTVENQGPDDISALSVAISLTGEGREAFEIKRQIVPILEKGSTATFDISTMIGLPVGTHTATVSILTDNSATPLDTFKVHFTVTANPIYNLKLTTNDADWGKPRRLPADTYVIQETYTAEYDEEVKITAIPNNDDETNPDYKFVKWEVISGDLTLSDPTQIEQTFRMPNGNVEIRAIFAETPLGALRLTELIVKDEDDNSYDLRKSDWTTVTFNPKTREYYVIVPNDVDKVKLWFKLRDILTADPSALPTLSVTHEHNSVTDNVLPDPTEDVTDNYYKSGEAELEFSADTPIDNILRLYITWDNPSDDPDEGPATGTYTVHVRKKLANSQLMNLNPGNSPFGLIEGSTSIADSDKGSAQLQFVSDGYMFTSGNCPENGTPNIQYATRAWASIPDDKDLDPKALFVLTNDSFVDPGWDGDIKNSIGEVVTGDVTKKITIRRLNETGPDRNGSSDDLSYTTAKTITLPDNGSITQLQSSSERIRPDTYEMTYSFTDFDGSTASVSRAVVILPPLGDVNISGAVEKSTSADNSDTAVKSDEYRLRHRFTTDIANKFNTLGYEKGSLLFKYRVCDVNNDGYVNAVDADYVRTQTLTQFYSNMH